MVAPIVGPFTQNISVDIGPRNVRSANRVWFRQVKPYNLPLPFTYGESVVTYSNTGPGDTTNAQGFHTRNPYGTICYNKAYAQLVDSLGDSSQWGVNIAEQKQGLDMIVKRAKQLSKFIGLVRRADFIGAANVFSLGGRPKGVSRKKTFANNFLEYHFGWEPLMKDVYAAVNTFTDPSLPVARPISGRGRANAGAQYSVYKTYESFRVRLGGFVQVDNPNLHLASTLGLVNPASVAWELVPFSFVVDWWANVGQVLSSYTDFAGCTLFGTYTSKFDICKSVRNVAGIDQRFMVIECSRNVGAIAGPSLVVKPFQGLSPVRGITAISLLVQKLR